MAAARDKEVGGFYVPVNNTFTMGGVQRIGDFDGQGQEGNRIDGHPGNAMRERDPFKKLHGDEGLAASLPNSALADFINGADIGMVERGGGACSPAEALERLGLRSDVFGKEFEGDEPSQVDVFGLVHDTHAATAQLLDDAVVRDGLADHG